MRVSELVCVCVCVCVCVRERERDNSSSGRVVTHEYPPKIASGRGETGGKRETS
jgi:hypothetical protein